MLRQESSDRIQSDRKGAATSNGISYGDSSRAGGVDIQRELNKLEELILDSPRFPLTRRTVVDEEQLLDQLDLIRVNLPPAFREAMEVLNHKEEILTEADHYAQEIIETAERRAAQMIDEMGLRRQAELEAQQFRQQVQQECEQLQERAIAEIERLQLQAQQEMEEMRRRTLAECEEIQAGADAYADRVLRDMEQQLADMLRIVRNGRQKLQPEPSVPKSTMQKPSGGSNPSRIPSPKSSERPKG